MHIDFASLSVNQRYHVMTQIVIPRPIAWVLTDNGELSGRQPSYNLAPFSYFNALCSDPPLIVMSIGFKPGGELKDTRRNILERNNLVVHIASQDCAEQVTASAAPLPHGESEVSRLGLSLVKQDAWALPRLERCRIAMACHLYDVSEIGPNRQGIIFCQIDEVFVSDEAVSLDAKGRPKIDAAIISPLSRLGASEYASLGEVFSSARHFPAK